MSESEYYQEEEKRASKLRKRSAAATLLDSDSEEEVKRVPKKSTKAARKSNNSKTKKELVNSEKSEKSGTSSSTAFNDLFGDRWEESQPPPLYSSLCRYLPTGTVRTTQVLDGEFFIELRVFDSAAIRELPYAKRYEEVQAILRLQLSHNDPQWVLVKQLFKEGKKKFDKEGVFYSKEKK